MADEPVDSVEVVAAHSLKMGWLEKESEESYFGGWSKRFAVLTGWDGQEAHLFYYYDENDKEAGGILFLSEMEIEDNKDPKVFTLQGSQRRFKFRCDSADAARSWCVAIVEAKTNGGHRCKAGEASLAWRKDKHAKTCQHCKRVFSVTICKHHCRCCGRIFCHECTGGEKLSLEPYPKPVRCCTACNKTQQTLIAKKQEMQQRAQQFVSRYLELLEAGTLFLDPDRADVRRTLSLDTAEGISLQFRSLAITEAYEIDAMADAIGSQAVTGGISLANNLKALTLRGVSRVRGVKAMRIEGQQVAKAFEPEQAKENIHRAGRAVGNFAVNAGGVAVDVAKATAGLAISLKDTVTGPTTCYVPIKDFIGVADCASSPSMLLKLKDKARVTFTLAYHAEGEERELLQV
jgi:hypothetical protein